MKLLDTLQQRFRPYVGLLAQSIAFRIAAVAAMVWIALYGETRPAPSLPDILLNIIPYNAWIERYNYVIWTAAYLPIALVLLWQNPPLFSRYMISAGLLAIFRGLCIAATGLGPTQGPDLHAGMNFEQRWEAFKKILNPLGALMHNQPGIYLTKDLFFSGHIATTFLLLLYVWPQKTLRYSMFVGHLAVLFCVFVGHLHYTIDIIGAYAITFSLFVLRERGFRWLMQT